MQYRTDKHGNQLSALGFGCMRFAHTKTRQIDMVKTEQQILAAYEAGVNYYDTAYIYPGSEAALGEILEKNNLRDKVNIATKLPHYLLKTAADVEKCFQEELRRLRTDHVDYYLMHMLPDTATWNRLTSMGIQDWIAEKKASGAIRNLGFSYHGNSSTFMELIDAYDWDFCQIQYNYIDENTQAGRRGLEHAQSKGIPVVIMEPLRGGRLVNLLPEKAVQRFKSADPSRSPAEWGLRWLYDQSGVTVVLSGMNSLEMVQENCRIAANSPVGCVTDAEREVYADVVQAINHTIKVGCTGCAYCMPCPRGVDIPGCFRAYNERYSEGFFTGMKEYVMTTTLRGKRANASMCVGCGRCEQHCPQHIEIRKELKNVVKVMENPIYKAASGIIKLAGHYGK